MASDCVTNIWIRGLRSLADVQLPVGGLTVLIGENGSGKSSLVEAFEILRKVGQPKGFLSSLVRIHDLHSLIANDASGLDLGVTIEGGGPKIEYSFTIERRRSGFAMGRERLDVFQSGHRQPLHAILRDSLRCKYFDQRSGRLEDLEVAHDHLGLRVLLEEAGKREQGAAARVSDVLASGDVHLPFEVRARWLCEERSWESPLRTPAVVERATGLERLGTNLVNAYAELKQRPDWTETLSDIRLGLGPDIRDVITVAASRGQLELKLRYAEAGDVPAVALSDGTLCYLAFVALVRLSAGSGFLVIDEPELHLDPGLMIRVLDMLAILSETTPVVIATHSDRLLDALDEPAQSVVLCELDAKRRTQLRRPSEPVLREWLGRYRGLGQLRSEAPLALVMDEPLPARPEPGGDEA